MPKFAVGPSADYVIVRKITKSSYCAEKKTSYEMHRLTTSVVDNENAVWYGYIATDYGDVDTFEKVKESNIYARRWLACHVN